MTQTAVCPRCGKPTTVHVWFSPHDDPGHIITVQKCGHCGYQWRDWTEKRDKEPPAGKPSKGDRQTEADKPKRTRH